MDKDASSKFDSILTYLKDIKGKLPKKEESDSRRVVKEIPEVVVEDLGKKARTFFQDLLHKTDKKTDDVHREKGNWITKLLILLGAAVYGAYLIFTTKIIPALARIGGLILKAGQLVYGFVKGIVTLLKNTSLTKVLRAIKTFFGSIVTRLKATKIGQFVSKIFRAIKGIFTGILNRAKATKLGSAVTAALRLVSQMFKDIKIAVASSKLGSAVTAALRLISQMFKDIKIAVASSKLGKAAMSVFSVMSKAFSIVTKMVAAAVKVGSKLVTGSIAVFGKVFSVIGSAFRFIGSKLSFLLTPIKVIGKLVSKLFIPLQLLLAAFDVVTETVKSVGAEGFSFTSVLKGVAGGLLKFFSFGYFDLSTINEVVESLSDFFGEVINFFTDLPENASKWFTALPSRITSALKSMFNTFIGYFTIDNFKEMAAFFIGLPGKLLTGIKNLIKKIPVIGDFFKTDADKAAEVESKRKTSAVADSVASRERERYDASRLRERNLARALPNISTVTPAVPSTAAPKDAPLLDLFKDVKEQNEKAAKTSDDVLDETQDQTMLLKEITTLLTKMLAKLDNMGTSNNIVVSNTKNNRISLGDIAGPSSFRSTVTP